VQKFYARGGGFGVGEMGMLGIVASHGVEFFYAPTRKHTIDSDFDIRDISSLPRVDVHYSYAGAEGSGKTDAQGVIVATTGLTPPERAYYDDLQKKGIVVATTFPSGQQVSSPASPREASPISVQHMLPLHARILMMLALTRTHDPREIQRIFDQY
jgi:L-asparaginase/Glu-tRNA(Gln) amidotransferase subunit D